MSRFTERLERDLNQIADRATPSSTAWSSIITRIAERADEPEMEVIMLAPDTTTTDRTRRWLLSVAAVAAVVALVVGLVIAGTGDDDEPVPADEPEATLPIEPEAGEQLDPVVPELCAQLEPVAEAEGFGAADARHRELTAPGAPDGGVECVWQGENADGQLVRIKVAYEFSSDSFDTVVRNGSPDYPGLDARAAGSADIIVLTDQGWSVSFGRTNTTISLDDLANAAIAAANAVGPA